jgi:hypothetical protein
VPRRAWTQAKGLTVGPPLDAADLLNVATEGTALVSSSSGFENAHEAETLRGSFFTHHFVAGLLGAADRAGDGNITLEEAFEYAKERTVRDSARLATDPQRPSFDLQLRGRQDIVLTTVSSSSSALEVMQTVDPIEIIHLPSGVTIAEVAPTSRGIRIAVPPVHYLVRSVVGGQVMSREFDVPAGTTVPVIEGQLEATGDPRGDRRRRFRCVHRRVPTVPRDGGMRLGPDRLRGKRGLREVHRLHDGRLLLERLDQRRSQQPVALPHPVRFERGLRQLCRPGRDALHSAHRMRARPEQLRRRLRSGR